MQNQQLKLNISLSQTTEVVCEACGSNVFTEVLYIRKAPKFLTGSPQDSLIPIGAFACAKCKHVNQDLRPQEQKSQTND